MNPIDEIGRDIEGDQVGAHARAAVPVARCADKAASGLYTASGAKRDP
jgi:hypothetical protein